MYYRLVTTHTSCTAYVDQLRAFPDAIFDVILVDGACRDACIVVAAEKVKPGGIVVVDSADEQRDVSPLRGFARHSTRNGIWQTDICVQIQIHSKPGYSTGMSRVWRRVGARSTIFREQHNVRPVSHQYGAPRRRNSVR